MERCRYPGATSPAGDYGFMISVVDADLTPSTEVDLFRMKIWDKGLDEVVYDNQRGNSDDADAATRIGGGSIKIHKSVVYDDPASKSADAGETLPSELALKGNYPNPFNPSTQVVYDVPQKSEVSIAVYDVQGQIVEYLASGVHEPGTYRVVFDGTTRPSGIYFAVMTSQSIRLTEKMLLLK